MYLVIVIIFALLLTDNLPPQGWNLLDRLVAGVGFTPASTAWVLIVVFGQILLVALVAAFLARRTLRARDGTPDGDFLVEDRFAQSGLILTGLLMTIVPLVMLCTNWLPLVRGIPLLRRMGLVADLVAALPFVASILTVWIVMFLAERVVREIARAENAADPETSPAGPPRAWSLGTYLAYKTRHQILTIMAPMAAVLAAKHLVDAFRQPILAAVRVPWAPDALIGISAALVLLVSPVLLRYLWVTRPLPSGPLRDRLEALCRRVGLRYREILVWESQGLVVNAAVMGLIPRVRYVLLSDGLLGAMTPMQIEAVFGHEAGHVRRHHLLYFGVFALLSMLLVGGLLEYLSRAAGLSANMLQLIALVSMLLIWGLAFGYISRKFERQADLYGTQCMTPAAGDCEPLCRVHAGPAVATGVCTSAARLFGRTLLDVAHLNGIPVDAPSWRHGTVQSRCDLLRQFAADPGAVRRFERNVAALKTALALLTAVGSLWALKLYWPF